MDLPLHGRPRARLALAAAFCCASLLGGVASGGATGLGAEALGLAGAVTAAGDGPAALGHNPAGAAAATPLQLEVGWQHLGDGLQCQSSDASGCGPVATGGALLVGLGARLPARGVLQDRIHLALLLGVDRDGPLDLSLGPPDQPRFLLREGLGRSTLLAGVGVHAGAGLTVGISVDYQLAWSDEQHLGPGVTERHVASGRSRLSNAAGVRIGARYRLGRALRLGLAYSSGLSLPVSVEQRIESEGGPLRTLHRADVLLAPPRVDLGALLHARRWLHLVADVGWVRWSRSPRPGLRTWFAAPPDAAGPGGQAQVAAGGALQDALEVRVAARATLPWRGWHAGPTVGLGYLGAPAPEETSGGVWLDGPRQVLGVGLSARRPLSRGLLHVTLGWRVQRMGERGRAAPASDGAALPQDAAVTGGGRLWDLALTLRWDR